MKQKQTIEVTKSREIKTYAHMWHTSDCLLEKGLESPKGSFHQFMASLVFTGFTLEAYLNHIGPKIFKHWEALERLGPKDKLNIISEQLGIDIDYGERPWQVMKKLFKFRNDIAHGKTKDIKRSYETPLDKHSDEKFGEWIRSEWEEYCTKENAERAREDVEKIVYQLYKAGSFENDYPFTQGFQFGSTTVVPL